jgi:hypothetical protein
MSTNKKKKKMTVNVFGECIVGPIIHSDDSPHRLVTLKPNGKESECRCYAKAVNLSMNGFNSITFMGIDEDNNETIEFAVMEEDIVYIEPID